MSYFGTKDTRLELRRGNVSGSIAVDMLSYSEEVNTTSAMIHHKMAIGALTTLALVDTPAVVKIASTSANDTNSAGTGARQVFLEGIDSSGNVQTETVNLNGQTEVTAGTYAHVRAMSVISVGSGGENAGDIWAGAGTFTSGVPATKYGSVSIGRNTGSPTAYVVPTGKTLYLDTASIVLGDTSKLLTIDFLTYNGIEYKIFSIAEKAGIIVLPADFFSGIAAGTLFGARAKVDTGTATVSMSITGTLVDD